MHALPRLLKFFLLAALAAMVTTAVRAIDYPAGPDDYRTLLARLQAGDRLLLRPGNYERGLPLHHLAGAPGRPIVIEGRPGTRFLAPAGQNTLSLVDASHLVIRNLELDGRNLPVDGVKAEGHSRYAHFITLENLHIHDYAASQQNVGISTKCPAFGWIVRGNRIERVGTGMYFGDSDGSDPFVAGLIEGNRISDSIGYNLQIKHQKFRPAGMPEPDSSHVTHIRNNFFAKDNAWPDRDARPNVLVGHAPLTGPGSMDRVLVYGNLFWQNPSEALFQGEGHLALYNNVFINTQGHGVHIQPHNDVPREMDIFHNTVLARGHGIRVLRRADEEWTWQQRVMRNLVFAGKPLSGGVLIDNLIGNYDAATRFLKHPYATELEQLDVTPRMFLPGNGDRELAGLASLPDIMKGIDGHPRRSPTPGACAADTESPCPRLAHVP